MFRITFLHSPEAVSELLNIIEKLEHGVRTQNNIDSVYNDFCDILKKNMYKDIPFKTVKPDMCNRKRRSGKPWWSDRLTELWSTLCTDERRWLHCNSRSDQAGFKSIYVSSRNAFDREVQRAKRFYWYSMQNELLSDCNNNNNMFWKSIGKVGVGYSKKKGIPMEVVLPSGVTCLFQMCY